MVTRTQSILRYSYTILLLRKEHLNYKSDSSNWFRISSSFYETIFLLTRIELNITRAHQMSASVSQRRSTFKQDKPEYIRGITVPTVLSLDDAAYICRQG